MQITSYNRFEVNITNKPYYAQCGIKYPQTATLTFYDINNFIIDSIDYGFLTTNEIYDQIEKGESLNLDYCYVKNFSLSTYRLTRLLEVNEIIKLYTVNARNAFFDSAFNIDFSYLKLADGQVDFSYSHFTKAKLNFSHTDFSDNICDFSNCTVFSKTVDFSNATFGKGELTFKNTIFYKGNKNFQYADFGEGLLNFTNTDFGDGNISFINANFNTGNAFFKVARFGTGEVDFHYSKFYAGDISFERVDFGNGNVNFKNVEFGKGKINFNRAVFGTGLKSFEGCTAQGRLTFKKANLSDGDIIFELMEFSQSELNLEKADFGKGRVSFLQSEFKLLSLSGCQINDYLDLRVKSCPNIELTNTIVRDIIDLKPYDFEVEIKTLNLFGMRLLGTIYIDWEANKVKELIQSQENTSDAQKADQFLTLKESFNKSGRYNDEDAAYVWFKRYEALAEFNKLAGKSKFRRVIQSPVYWFKKLVFDYAGLYATNPMRVLFSMIVTLAVFGFIYTIVLLTNTGGIVSGIGDDHNLIGTIGRSFYHSGITFFTIGYGDFYPMGAIRWLSNLEGFVGVFLMSYFTVAFVRKILR